MGTLFISFLVAIGGAVGLVVMSRTFDLETYTSRIFPLIPILYAIIYEVLEKKRTGKSRPIPPSEARQEMKAAATTLFQNITVGRVAGDVGIAFLIKFALEVFLTMVHLAVSGQTFGQVYGKLGVETVDTGGQHARSLRLSWHVTVQNAQPLSQLLTNQPPAS